MTDSTGPKISSRATSMSGVTSSRIVGADERAVRIGARLAAVDDAASAPSSTPAVDPAAGCGRAPSLETTGPTSVPLVEAVADRSASVRALQRRQQALVRVADRDDHRARHAALAGRAERASR